MLYFDFDDEALNTYTLLDYTTLLHTLTFLQWTDYYNKCSIFAYLLLKLKIYFQQNTLSI